MKKVISLSIVSLIVGYLIIFEKEKRDYKDAGFMNTVEIAPIDEALTFARFENNGKLELLAVIRLEQDKVRALNLTKLYGKQFTDPIVLFNKFGYTHIKKTVDVESKQKSIQLEASQLLIPVELTSSHVATGTNFSAHAEESSVEEGPFLFAKMVTPTPFNAEVSAGDGLLDYEVELSFVTLTDIKLPEVPEFMGLILSNDFTDRAKLMRNLNPEDVTSGDGFTTGKSAAGYLPVGNLFVIPYDLDKFVDGIQLSLAVNGKLRQNGNMKQIIWDIAEILRQTQAKEGKKWRFVEKDIELPIEDGILPKRTLILSGTPEGTIFNGITAKIKISGLMSWLVGGWNKPITDHVIEKYIDNSMQSNVYLHSGDRVTIQVEHLGFIDSTIIK